MKKEIKFRVWNGEQMISPDYIDREGLGWWKENSIPNSSEKLMQFTGLKDKNGKEIYEGDILRIRDQKEIRDVIWDDFSWLTRKIYSEHTSLYYLSENEKYEVIGNIYENPEFLTPAKNQD